MPGAGAAPRIVAGIRLELARYQHLRIGVEMAGNSRTTFTKRSKERARQEKRAEKSQKMEQRKLEKGTAPVERTGEPVIQYDEDGQPIALDFNDF